MAGAPRTSAFMVEVLFRDNTTIQGEVTWLGGEKKRSFRSAVELVHLILEGCDGGQVPGGSPAGIRLPFGVVLIVL
jgi:hypothetical protein